MFDYSTSKHKLLDKKRIVELSSPLSASTMYNYIDMNE